MKTPEEALSTVLARFPFIDYIHEESDVYRIIPATVAEYLRPPARVLDFGAGPCDKTAVLASMGYDCTACDDLNDNWHRLPGNREKILAFAGEMGIEFHLLEGDHGVPFPLESFDMLMMNDVLEHLHNSPRELLVNLLGYVKPGGYLLITVPNLVNLMKRVRVLAGKTNLGSYESYFWTPGQWRGHIREYVRDDLLQLAHFLNLEILQLKSCNHMLYAMPKALRPVWCFLTGILRNGKDSLMLLARKNPGWSAVNIRNAAEGFESKSEEEPGLVPG